MMLSAAFIPVYGNSCPVSGETSFEVGTDLGAAARDVSETVPEDFGRVVALYQGNEHLLSELQKVRERLIRASTYLRSPGCNRVLGEAHLLQSKARHSALLAMLRANRVAARRLLGRPFASDDCPA
jgi:hypothetical protein